METQYDCISEARDMLQLLGQSEYYKDLYEATLRAAKAAHHDAYEAAYAECAADLSTESARIADEVLAETNS